MKQRIRSLILAAAIVAALAAVPASAQPSDVPMQGWTCHKYGAYLWQWHCHY